MRPSTIVASFRAEETDPCQLLSNNRAVRTQKETELKMWEHVGESSTVAIRAGIDREITELDAEYARCQAPEVK
jgi:hypothetical protein